MCTAHVCSQCSNTVSSQKTPLWSYLPLYSLRLFAYLYRPLLMLPENNFVELYTSFCSHTGTTSRSKHAASSLNVSMAVSNCKHLHCHDCAVSIHPVLILVIYSVGKVVHKSFLHRQDPAPSLKAALSRSHDLYEYANAPNHSSRAHCMPCCRQAAGVTVCV